MAMGKRTSKQAPMFVAATELPVWPGHPFYAKLNTILDGAGFDRFAVRTFVGRNPDAAAPDHSTISPGAIAASRPGAQPSLRTAAKLDEILAR